VDDLAVWIKNLERKPALVRQYSEAGLAFARSLDWEALLPQWLEVIRSATGVDLEAEWQAGAGQTVGTSVPGATSVDSQD
jgi:hypothetical protein